MLICDTHADTLWALATGAHSPLDITRDALSAAPHVRVQALALYVSTGGMAQNPTIVERELRAFETLKAGGWHPITEIRQAQAGCANVLLTIEGGEAFAGDPDQVDRFAALGVRVAALTWNNENGLCHPAVSGSREGLSPLGRAMVRRMRTCRMAVDTSHLNERGFFDLLDGNVPPMASHSCAHALCPHPRNLTDDQLRALFEAGGFVGVNFYPRFLRREGTATLDDVIDHMAHMCELGGEAHVGLGSDFDGIECWPDGLRTAADVPRLLDRMLERGFGHALTEAIAGKNFEAYMGRL